MAVLASIRVTRGAACPAPLTAELLAELWAQPEPRDVLRRAPGRLTARVQGPDGLDLVLKRTQHPARREGFAEHLRRARPRCPAEREFDALVALHGAGHPVPTPYAWIEAGRGAARGAAVVMGTVTHFETVRQRLLREPAAAQRLVPELARLVARLHGAGWYHRDLYLEHVVLRADTGGLALLDLGRARHGAAPRRRWFVKDLAALAHSAPVEEEARCRFLALYLELRGIDPREAPAWGRAALARARRIARHAPRHVDPRSREGGVS